MSNDREDPRQESSRPPGIQALGALLIAPFKRPVGAGARPGGCARAGTILPPATGRCTATVGSSLAPARTLTLRVVQGTNVMIVVTPEGVISKGVLRAAGQSEAFDL